MEQIAVRNVTFTFISYTKGERINKQISKSQTLR